jgi:hypothetical protein
MCCSKGDQITFVLSCKLLIQKIHHYWYFFSEPPRGLKNHRLGTTCLGHAMLQFSHRKGSGSLPGLSIWKLRRTKWHWDKFFSEFFTFICQNHSIGAIHNHVSHGGMNNRPVRSCSSETQSHPIDMNSMWKFLFWLRRFLEFKSAVTGERTA